MFNPRRKKKEAKNAMPKRSNGTRAKIRTLDTH